MVQFATEGLQFVFGEICILRQVPEFDSFFIGELFFVELRANFLGKTVEVFLQLPVLYP